MLIVRVKQCEMALKGGRLDEAFDLLRAPDLRNHRRGQDIVDRLCRAMLDRGKKHLGAGQLDAAVRDCEKAAALSGNLAEVAQLRAAVGRAMTDRRTTDQRCEQFIGQARRHIDQGQLSVAEKMLVAAPLPLERADQIQRELTARRGAIESAVQKASAALKLNDWDGAIDHLVRLDRASCGDPGVREIATRINGLVVAQATEAIESGRLDLAASLLERHARLPGQWLDADQLRQTLRQCRQASERIQEADHGGAERVVRALATLWPRAKWLQEARRQVQELRTTSDDLLAGPLRLAGALAATPIGPRARAAVGMPPTPAPPIGQAPALPETVDVVLQVDGAGGFRLIGKPVVTIGPSRSSTRIDVPLMADASLPTITITRADGDYFLRSSEPVSVNDKPVSHKLLADGDRISPGPRCRIRFRRPSAASASAVLEVSGARLARGDVRQIILMDREVVVGPGAPAHIRADDLSGPAVLQYRDGQLLCRTSDPILLDGQPASSPAAISSGTRARIGAVGLVMVKEE